MRPSIAISASLAALLLMGAWFGVRAVVSAGSAGPYAALITASVIVLGAAALIFAILAVVAVRNRAARELEAVLQVQAPEAKVLRIVGGEDFTIGLTRLSEIKASMPKTLVLKVGPASIEIWGSTAGPILVVPFRDIAAIECRNRVTSNGAQRSTILLTVRDNSGEPVAVQFAVLKPDGSVFAADEVATRQVASLVNEARAELDGQ